MTYSSLKESEVRNSFKSSGSVAGKRDKWIKSTSLVLLAALGPSVVSGIRLEHLIIYPLALGFILWRWDRKVIPNASFIVKFILLYGIIWSIFSTSQFYPLEKILSSLDNSLLVVATLVAAEGLVRYRENWKAFAILIIFCGFMSILEVVNINSPVFNFFLGASAKDPMSVWQLSATMGRYNGIFFQPIEAGVAYSCFLVYWVSLLKFKRINPIYMSIILLFIFAGGLLSVSKVFIYSAIPILLYTFIFLANNKIRLILIAIALFISIILVNLSNIWDGLDYFLRLFSFKNVSIVDLLSAGRYGSDSSIQSDLQDIISNYPMTGYGLKGIDAADSFFLYALAQGGWPLLVLHSTLLAIVIFNGIKQILFGNHFPMLLAFVAFAGALGGPVFFLNRSSTIFWLLWVIFNYMSRNRNSRLRVGVENDITSKV
ncbi:hypothetical protein ACINK0_06235 [Deinococcus sp. VB343]|uniref:hypothetical protein n=1 Tax=Deinococcus sp. VB343 TaxID=3385567 RepID=UPI0039C9BFD3